MNALLIGSHSLISFCSATRITIEVFSFSMPSGTLISKAKNKNQGTVATLNQRLVHLVHIVRPQPPAFGNTDLSLPVIFLRLLA